MQQLSLAIEDEMRLFRAFSCVIRKVGAVRLELVRKLRTPEPALNAAGKEQTNEL